MSRSKSNRPDFPPESDEDEEVEILEIVGVVDDDPRLSGRPADDRDRYLLDLEQADGAPEPGALDGERLVRLQADFENYKKRVERETEATRRQASARLVKELLPVLDNFERAVAATPATTEEGNLHSGIVLIFRQLLDALRAEGLAAIDSLGQPFDPNLHEAVATESSSELPANTIVEELQRGYLLHHRLLRPSLVKVTVSPRRNEPSEPDGGA